MDNDSEREDKSGYYQSLPSTALINIIENNLPHNPIQISAVSHNDDMNHQHQLQEHPLSINNASSRHLPSKDFLNSSRDAVIDSITDRIIREIFKTKEQVEREKERIASKIKSFKAKRKEEQKSIAQARDSFQEQLKLAKYCSDKDIIDLNIGGTHRLSTSRGILRKYPGSALGLMFSGNISLIKDKNNYYFVDRDGKTFSTVINYLRNGSYPLFNSPVEEENFRRELSFWNIPLTTHPVTAPQFCFESKWGSKAISLNQAGDTITVNRSTMSFLINQLDNENGLVCCSPSLNAASVYIEFNVNIEGEFGERNQLYIGLIDKHKYIQEGMRLNARKRSPLMYFWDIWNSRLIHSTDNSTEVGRRGEYGCQCKKNKMIIGLRYDCSKKTLEYFLNGMNLGVAFKGVPSHLSFCVDIGFASGSVEIVNPKKIKQNSRL